MVLGGLETYTAFSIPRVENWPQTHESCPALFYICPEIQQTLFGSSHKQQNAIMFSCAAPTNKGGLFCDPSHLPEYYRPPAQSVNSVFYSYATLIWSQRCFPAHNDNFAFVLLLQSILKYLVLVNFKK